MAKNDYKTLLKLLTTTTTQTALANKLTELSIDADDRKLARIAHILAEDVRPKPHERSTVKMCLSAGVTFWQSQHETRFKNRASNILLATKYCQQCIAAIEPDWMLQAKAAGWTPPKVPGTPPIATA